MSNLETFEFATESKQVLDLMIHSVYSNKDIFLRELISNASDAIDKLRFESLTNKGLVGSDSDFKIQIEIDKNARTITVEDNGIGMNKTDVIRNIGTIARSGTKEFVEQLKQSKDTVLPPELIGQFGVGFYSCFMVAQKIVLWTCRAGEKTTVRWESIGDGQYTIEELPEERKGTKVVLYLKNKDEEDGLKDYTDTWVVQGIIKKYSDFVTYPVLLPIPELDKDGKEKGIKIERINSQKPIWERTGTEVKDEEYNEFYHHISHDWQNPLKVVPFKAEGTMEYKALLFIPSKAPHDLYYRDAKPGVHLYVKRVFIMDDCREILPDYLRFIKGVVDASDLSLNVSREILQKSRQITQIRNRLVKKILEILATLQEKEKDKYLTFWKEFGRTIKEGLTSDYENQDRLKELILVDTSKGESEQLITLREYVSQMKPGQEHIYYLTGKSRKAVEIAPHLETFRAKDIEVIFFTDPVDEMLVNALLEFDGKKLKSIEKGNLDIGTEAEKKKLQEDQKSQNEEYKSLMDLMRGKLQDYVKEVRLSTRLTDSAVCLVSEEDEMSMNLERILKEMNRDIEKRKRILEINPNHAVIHKMKDLFEKDKKDSLLEDYAHLLYGQALLSEGSELHDPIRFSRLIADLMIKV